MRLILNPFACKGVSRDKRAGLKALTIILVVQELSNSIRLEMALAHTSLKRLLSFLFGEKEIAGLNKSFPIESYLRLSKVAKDPIHRNEIPCLAAARMAACLASLLVGGAVGAESASLAPSLEKVETDEGLALAPLSFSLRIFAFFVSSLIFCFAADSSLSISMKKGRRRRRKRENDSGHLEN